jgi:hypothetical protein
MKAYSPWRQSPRYLFRTEIVKQELTLASHSMSGFNTDMAGKVIFAKSGGASVIAASMRRKKPFYRQSTCQKNC